jgi:hypothetical protein
MHTEVEAEALISVIKALQDIVKEVAGGSTPFSADSYLPQHLVDRAQDALKSVWILK